MILYEVVARKQKEPESQPVSDSDPLARGNASGRATREVMIQTAERLFAERGVEGVSLREIGLACGQRNNYATQYHFGNRDSLIKAIYEYRARELNEHRLEGMAKLEEQGDTDDPLALLHILLEPHADHIGDQEWHFLGFLARLRVSRGQLPYFEGERPDYMKGFDVIRQHIQKCFCQLTDDEFSRRFEIAFGWAIHAMAAYERTSSAPGPYAVGVPEVLDEIIMMLVGALGAGSSSTPGRLRAIGSSHPEGEGSGPARSQHHMNGAPRALS